ncbi:MAG: hypothetical protein GX442_15860 [Candidatus Riflebacteria bacterium]|nr:hypothetical protein [Candidatus Riflebacteria bacterium]
MPDYPIGTVRVCDVTLMITFVGGQTSIEPSRRRNLGVVQEFLRREGKPHGGLETFTASLERSGKKD